MARRGTGVGPNLVACLRAAVAVTALIVAAGQPHAGPLSSRGPTQQGQAVQTYLLVRTGDVAPVPALLGSPNQMARLPGGGLVFSTDDGAVLLRDAAGTRILLHRGDEVPGCGNLSYVLNLRAGADGSIGAFLYCGNRLVIVRLDTAGGPPEIVLGDRMPLPGLPGVVDSVRGLAIDGMGRFVASVYAARSNALVRISRGGPPEILLKSGDPIGTGTWRFFDEPVVTPQGKVVFRGVTSDDREAIATLTPGSAPEVLVALPLPPGYFGPPGPGPHLPNFSSPSSSDSGVVAFLRHTVSEGEGGSFQLRTEVLRVIDGTVETIAAPGDPAPGGGTFDWIDSFTPPVVEASGAVLFSARDADSSQNPGLNPGLYRFDGALTLVAGPGTPTTAGETLYRIRAAFPCADGSLLITGSDTEGELVLVERDGGLSVEMRPGETLSEPARFTALSLPRGHLASGPFVAEDGIVVFDADVTGRDRGLYIRFPDGTLAPVALDGDPAPDGGHYNGYTTSFHSAAAGGWVAFLGSTVDGPAPWVTKLFAGFAGGAMAEVAREEQLIPGYDAPIATLMPPSRIDASGRVVIPVALSDGASLLLLWDGSDLRPIVRSGDRLPDGETIADIRTGETGALLPPLLDDADAVIFGVVTASGKRALYRIPATGDLDAAIRILGDGDLVEGGRLQPMLLRALSIDGLGRLAFQAVSASEPTPVLSTWVADGGSVPRRVAGPGDILENSFVVTTAWPRLAAVSGGIVHDASSAPARGMVDRVLFYATPAVRVGNTAEFEQLALDRAGTSAPDGDTFAGLRYGIGYGCVGPIGVPCPPPPAPMNFDRLGSDGDRYVVSLEATSQGAELMTLFDLRPAGVPPMAAAGSDLVVECAGPSGALVHLDGSGSVDPSQGALDYTWSTPTGTVTGPNPALTLPVGSWKLSLRVTNEAGLSASDSLTVTVRDSRPPSLTVRAVPDTLWPVDGRMVPVQFEIGTQDVCDPTPRVRLAAVSVRGGRGDLGGDVAGADVGTDDRAIELRASGPGGRAGGRRDYNVVYEVADAAGNRTSARVTITVPRRPQR